MSLSLNRGADEGRDENTSPPPESGWMVCVPVCPRAVEGRGPPGQGPGVSPTRAAVAGVGADRIPKERRLVQRRMVYSMQG